VNQAEDMLAFGGDEWLRRNRDHLGQNDPVTPMIKGSEAASILEIGCANGWRLKKLEALYGCRVAGIEPSAEAVAEAKTNGVNVTQGVATALPYADAEFHIVILGYCLWFIAPEDWFKVVAETDRVLCEGGALFIHDLFTSRAMREPLLLPDGKWHDKLEQFHYDWTKLWLSHPGYRTVLDAPVELAYTRIEMVSVLQKNMANACHRLRVQPV